MNSRNLVSGLVALSVAEGRLAVNGGHRILAGYRLQWLPIADAPQDGTRLMLRDSVSKRPVFGSWRGDNPAITHFAAEPAGKLHLWVSFHQAPGKALPDDDNMLGRFKAYRDGIAQVLGIDDKRFISHPLVSSERRPGGQVVVRITGGPAAAGHSTTGERA